MKIGFSFGRCLGSIMRGEVAFEDVLCIIARTRMQTEEHVKGVVQEYMWRPGYLQGLDQTQCEEMGVRLFSSGKILEPRANGISPMQVPRDYIWMDLFPTAAEGVDSDAVKNAWDHYRMLILLTEQLPEEGYVPEHSERAKPITPEEEQKLKESLDLLQQFVV
jgi:hypothetical protein